ncbi:hypothetical protein LPTSP4_33620 [Leptospira ryugenii]|uniref:Uncharacterized protein n=1 Tax=Leptospira ryugenii TaxID=1917863 RepID=A0A2P2E4N8_9LEPT|nr:hypothetical protein [Leptospira ryugenii]GBF51824.1 hypothetical protein LPTSP4_33620 [Leptospira ryugenii]
MWALDHVIFDYLFFKFPNEMEWDSSHWYNFLSLRKKLEREGESEKVLFAGSSVSLYSILPEKLFQDQTYKGQYYSHVAMAPTDLYYYREHISELKPKAVVYIVNFADLQWEYVEVKDGKTNFNEKLWTSEFSDRIPAKNIYPFAFLKDHYQNLTKKQTLSLLGKSLLNVNRVRAFFFDPIEVWFENHFRSGRSYHRYAGEKPSQDIWAAGWIKEEATMTCTLDREVDDYIFSAKDQATIHLEIWGKNKSVSPIFQTEISFKKKGWHKFPWEKFPKISQEFRLHLKMKSDLITAKEANIYHYGKDFYVGIRLSHFFCKAPNFTNKSYIRESFFDEIRFNTMSDQAYEEDYRLRILQSTEKRPELRRLNTIRDKKSQISNLEFVSWLESDRILQLSEHFQKMHIPFIVILSPENPIESQLYIKGKWFAGFRNYLSSQLEKNGHYLWDLTEVLPYPQLFFDPHHLTYNGALEFTKIMEPKLIEILGEKR